MGDERKMAAALLLMAPGAPFIYYGEEIGLTSPTYEAPDSDRRGPMWWSSSNGVGITDPPPEWNWPYKAPDGTAGGVEEQLANENSLLRYYIKVSNLKNKYPWLAYGYQIKNLNSIDDGDYKVESGSIAAYRVSNPDNPAQKLVIAHNTNYYTDISIYVRNAADVDGFSAKNSAWHSNLNSGTISLPPYSTTIITEF
jgi:glycosidase